MSEPDQPDRYGPERKPPHWCETCHGHTGPDSPCYEGTDDDEQSKRAGAAMTESDIPKVMELARECEGEFAALDRNTPLADRGSLDAARAALLAELQRLALPQGEPRQDSVPCRSRTRSPFPPCLGAKT